MVRLWCRAFAAEVNFIANSAAVVANFSGVLCVDEVYQGELALLLTDGYKRESSAITSSGWTPAARSRSRKGLIASWSTALILDRSV